MSRTSLIDLASEVSTLGAALLNREQAEILRRSGRQDDFAYSANRKSFDAIKNLGPPFDYAVICAELQKRGELEEIGGTNYILDLDRGVVVECSMAARIATLREWSRLRRLVRLGEWLSKEPYSVATSSFGIITSARTQLEEIAK